VSRGGDGIGPIGWLALAGAVAGVAALTWSADNNVSLLLATSSAITGNRTRLPMNTPIGRHFTISDVAGSVTARRNNIDNTPTDAAVEAARALAINVLDPIVDAVGPIQINSWFRSPALNKRVGGSRTSQHMLGTAADIVLPGTLAPDFARRVLRAGVVNFDQLIGYSPENGGQLHISWEGAKNRREILWSPRKKVYIAWKPLAPEGQRFA
jgi:hypothetical protein